MSSGLARSWRCKRCGRVLLFELATVFRIMYAAIQEQMSKKIPISVRLDPEVKAGADKLAKMQNRTLTNLIETLLKEACQKHGIKAQERGLK